MKAELSHGQKALLCLGAGCVSTPKSSHGGKRRPGPETRRPACQLSPRRGPGCPSLELCAAKVNQASLVSKTAGVTCSHQTLPPRHPGDHAREGWWCERHQSLPPPSTEHTDHHPGNHTVHDHHCPPPGSTFSRGRRATRSPPRSSLHLQALRVGSQQASLFNHNTETYRSSGWSPWGCANHTPPPQDMFTCSCHLLPSLHALPLCNDFEL